MLTEAQKRNLERAVKAATAMGASNPLTTEADNPWEESSNIVQLKTGFGDSGFKVGTAAVAYTAEGDDSTGDFDNGETGSNITHDGTAWGNDLSYGSDLITGAASASGTGGYSGDTNYSYAIDGNTGTSWLCSGGTLTIDLGSGNEVEADAIKIYTAGTGGFYDKLGIISGSNNGSDFDTLKTYNANITDGSYLSIPLTTTGVYRYYKFTFEWMRVADIQLVASTYASSYNTITTNELVSSGTVSFDPSSLVVKDEADGIIAGDTFNIDYDKNGAGFVGLMPQSTFKALAASVLDGCTSLLLKIQPVDDETIKSVQLSTVSSGSVALKTGSMTITVGGSVVYKTETDGDVTATDITCDDITMTGTLALPSNEYIRFGDADVNGSWRMTAPSGEFLHQARVSGEWTTMDTITQ